MTPRPRVGHIPFLNCRPLHFGLVQTGAIDQLDLVSGTPAELARALLDGKLDVAPLSSIEYLRHAEQFLLLPDLAIGSAGAVRSVQLVSQVRPGELPGELRGPVAMTSASATSQALLQVLLKDLWSVDVECFSCDVEIPQVFERAEAALLIGDEALRIATARPAGLHLADLGEAWMDLSGLPMTYAVWAARREFADRQPAALAAVTDALDAAMAWGLDHLAEAIDDAVARDGWGERELDEYFAGLEYGFDGLAREGLMAFAERARDHGLLAEVPELEFTQVCQ